MLFDNDLYTAIGKASNTSVFAYTKLKKNVKIWFCCRCLLFDLRIRLVIHFNLL